MSKERLFSNEIVFRGHPDKVADQISDAVLEACLIQDPESRVAVEVAGGKTSIFLTGEITSSAVIDVEEIVNSVLTDVGYSNDYKIINDIGTQSPDISQGVDIGGAGDIGMMFGYATNETDRYLPKAMVILQEFSRAYDELRKIDDRFLPDGKAQITGVYQGGKLQRIKTITICYQNTEVEREETDRILRNLYDSIAGKYGILTDEYLFNPTGKFTIGGFEGDAGLTGRKIVVDTYHSFARVGGGAFSGKDATKVDRSGAYKAREVAKDILVEHDLEWCEVQVSYAIGLVEPLAIYINTDIGELETPKYLYNDFAVENIIKDLKLRDPNAIDYVNMAAFGHFVD